MTVHATGTFDVKMTPQTAGPESPDDTTKAGSIGRMSLDKQFHGHLEATSKGQMLAAGTSVKAPRVTWPSRRSAERSTAAPAPSSSNTAAQ